jgi:DNA-binding LytR/AlgR family response regulator
LRNYEFLNGETLLEAYRDFGIIFLDIDMKGDLDGIQLAQMLHLRDSGVLICFYTAYDYPASRIVAVQPFRYLLKNWTEQELKSVLQLVLIEAVRRKKAVNLAVSYEGKRFMLKSSDILYISILGKGTEIYLTEERAAAMIQQLKISVKKPGELVIKSAVKLEKYYAQLADLGFIYGKVSYIIESKKHFR